MKPSEDRVLSEFWATNYVGSDGKCILCENTGFVTPHAIIVGTPDVYCFCPNGRALREAHGSGSVLTTEHGPDDPIG